MNKTVVHWTLLKRFRKETGQIQAERLIGTCWTNRICLINIKVLDWIRLQCRWHLCIRIQEIIDNIHFYDKVPTTGTEQYDNVDYDELIDIIIAMMNQKYRKWHSYTQSSRSEDVSVMECEDFGAPFDLYDFDHEALIFCRLTKMTNNLLDQQIQKRANTWNQSKSWKRPWKLILKVCSMLNIQMKNTVWDSLILSIGLKESIY